MENEMIEMVDAKQMESTKVEFGGILNTAIRLSKQIKDVDSYKEAAEYLFSIKKRLKWWIAFNKPIKDKIRASLKEAICREDILREPLERAEREYLKPAISDFDVKQEAERRAKQMKAEEEHRKQQEDAKLKLAVEYENQGEKDAAIAVLEQPIVKTSIELPIETKVAGMSFRWDYSCVVVDRDALLRAVLEAKAPEVAVIPNIPFLNQLAKSMKEGLNIPGVELRKQKITSVRV